MLTHRCLSKTSLFVGSACARSHQTFRIKISRWGHSLCPIYSNHITAHFEPTLKLSDILGELLDCTSVNRDWSHRNRRTLSSKSWPVGRIRFEISSFWRVNFMGRTILQRGVILNVPRISRLTIYASCASKTIHKSFRLRPLQSKYVLVKLSLIYYFGYL